MMDYFGNKIFETPVPTYIVTGSVDPVMGTITGCDNVAAMHNTPINFRLAKKANGELILQGAFPFQRNFTNGVTWKDLETVDYVS